MPISVKLLSYLHHIEPQFVQPPHNCPYNSWLWLCNTGILQQQKYNSQPSWNIFSYILCSADLGGVPAAGSPTESESEPSGLASLQQYTHKLVGNAKQQKLFLLHKLMNNKNIALSIKTTYQNLLVVKVICWGLKQVPVATKRKKLVSSKIIL